MCEFWWGDAWSEYHAQMKASGRRTMRYASRRKLSRASVSRATLPAVVDAPRRVRSASNSDVLSADDRMEKAASAMARLRWRGSCRGWNLPRGCPGCRRGQQLEAVTEVALGNLAESLPSFIRRTYFHGLYGLWLANTALISSCHGHCYRGSNRWGRGGKSRRSTAGCGLCCCVHGVRGATAHTVLFTPCRAVPDTTINHPL